MDMDTFLNVFFAFLFLGIPGAALTIRFVLRPMLREVVEAVRATRGAMSPELEKRLAEIEESQQLVGQKLDRLLEAERFRQELKTGAPQPPGVIPTRQQLVV